MRKFYIPTTSLNFNNILSTESISPKAFYQRRRFGYSRWFDVPENSCEFAITLYDHPGSFSRPQGDMEDHPLLIELASDEEFVNAGDGVYFCDHTLYFSPTTTRFVFFAAEDRHVALSLSENSLETKLVAVYRQRIVVETFKERLPTFSGDLVQDCNESAVAYDRNVNRMEGLLYGYYVGASLSTTSEMVGELTLYLKLQDIFASIVSCETRTPTESQKRQLEEIFWNLTEFDPLFGKLVEFEGGCARANQLLDLCRSHGKELLSFDSRLLVSSLRDNTDAECRAMRWVKENVRRVRNAMRENRIYLSPEKDEIIVIDGKLSRLSSSAIEDESLNRLFCKWVNEVLVRADFTGKISSCKEALSDALTVKAKEFYGEEWTDANSVRTYLNKLRKHVRGDGFDVAWDNGVLSSLAAVLTHGDDWESLLRFMQGKGLSDYRLAYAIYGELNGFANLTRDFTDIILCGQNEKRRAVYKEFHGQLLNQDVDYSVADADSLEAREESGEYMVAAHERHQNPNGWREEVRAFVLAMKLPKSYTAKKRGDLMASFDNVASYSANALDLLQHLQAEQLWKKRTSVYKTLKEKMEKDGYIPGITQEELQLQENGPSEVSRTPSGEHSEGAEPRHSPQLIFDPDLPGALAEFVQSELGWDEKKKESVRGDVKWLQEGYTSGGRYAPKPHDNASTMRHLVNLINVNLEKKNCGPSETDKKEITDFLRQRYERGN